MKIKHIDIPLNLVCVTLPEGFEVIDTIDVPSVGGSVLLQNRSTGIYVIWFGNAVHSIDQKDAAAYHSRMRLKSVSEATGKSLRQIGIELGIPPKTMEKWSCGSSNPPKYVLDLIDEHYGI